MSILERIRNNPVAYEDFKAWIENECFGEEESEELAQEYAELLEMFNPLGIKF